MSKRGPRNFLGASLLVLNGLDLVGYCTMFSMNRMKMVATWARTALPAGVRVVLEVPVTKLSLTAQPILVQFIFDDPTTLVKVVVVRVDVCNGIGGQWGAEGTRPVGDDRGIRCHHKIFSPKVATLRRERGDVIHARPQFLGIVDRTIFFFYGCTESKWQLRHRNLLVHFIPHPSRIPQSHSLSSQSPRQSMWPQSPTASVSA